MKYFILYIQPLKMEMIEGSETSANHNRAPGKYPKEYIQYSKHDEVLKSRTKLLFGSGSFLADHIMFCYLKNRQQQDNITVRNHTKCLTFVRF